jgi:hypothetical protein
MIANSLSLLDLESVVRWLSEERTEIIMNTEIIAKADAANQTHFNTEAPSVILQEKYRISRDAPSRRQTLSSLAFALLPGTVRHWFHFSLLRQVLLETRNLAHRISLSRRTRTVLNYAEVRQTLPQVACSDSRNEMQFCSASIQKLSSERPYLTLADLRLFAAGFFLAEKWFLRMDNQYRNEQQDSQKTSEGAAILRRA